MEEQWPMVTFVLIVLNLAIFLFFPPSSELLNNFGLSPQILSSKPYTIATHMFLHIDAMHLAVNMAMLIVLGMVLESKIGSGRFLFIYLFSGLCAVPFAFIIEALSGIGATLVGASAAIFGLMFVGGAVCGWEPMPLIRIPLIIPITLYLVITTAMFLQNFPASITEFAHFGGFIGGVLGFFLASPTKSLNR